MKSSQIYQDFSPIQNRVQIVTILIEVLFLVLALYYWKVQILDYKKYWKMSEANRTREVIIRASRGVLTDRGGSVILADNQGAFNASLIRENCKNPKESYPRISRLLGLTEDELKKRIEKYVGQPLFKPIVVKDNLDFDEVARIEARKADLPELVIETEPRRFYPFQSLGAHVIGYMQEPSPEELRTVYKDRRLGDLVGKTGIEAMYDSRLVGVDGKATEVVDSLGRIMDELSRVEPNPAPKLRLTLDYDLQAKAEELLTGREGSIIVLDAKTGDVLALASFPTFDPNKFINRFTPEEWLGLLKSPDTPLINRAIQGLYSPGSIFKIVMASGGLASGVITDQTTFFCGGRAEFYGHPFDCWLEGGHGALSLFNAIRYSCNVYFYNVARRMGIEEIAASAQKFGLGAKTGIDLPGEKEGLVPTPEWKKKTRNATWYPGETISVGIGQGPLQVTPLQISAMTALVANRGIRVRPHLLRGEDSSPGQQEARVSIESGVFEKVIEGMWRSVNEQGTGQAARVDNFNVCGKTGSSQTVSSEKAEKMAPQMKQKKTHAWFTGFAPRDNPQVVVTVLVEFGGMGGATAAPLAQRIFALYQDKYDRQKTASGN
ncbi:MAG: penicillin-binding protein 2 [Candidatus Aminicenantes bacterium]|nr:penicillin-binding protein 2 [Candidatus Aminicenantes bacterium]